MRPIEDRFWPKVEKTDGCWLWKASKLQSGYGQLGANKRGGKISLAHRVSWEIHHGPVPLGKHVLHTCDVRACVNPAHLFVGTQQTNMADRDAKGRCPRGEESGQAKLTNDIVRAIRAATGSQRDIARRFGISYQQVHVIVRGKTWRHLL